MIGMANEEEVIGRTFTEYVRTFQSLNPRRVVPYFHLPCLFASSQGVRVMTDAEEAETVIAELMERLKARYFLRSEVTDSKISQLSEKTALVSVGRIRYKTDGGELERLGETYLFIKSGECWRIVAAMTHDPDSIVCKC
jgi:hypothetical protein